MRFSTVVLDFDGTVTRVEEVAAAFLKEYRAGLSAATGRDLSAAWDRNLAFVHTFAPQLAWKWGGWEVCPAAPDPYIAASTAAELTLEEAGLLSEWAALPGTLYAQLYPQLAAPFRAETAEVLAALVGTGARVCFVSNASTGKIAARLDTLLPAEVRKRVEVVGDAGKFLVREATASGPMRARFDALPVALPLPGLHRPALPRRGRYFDALQRLWGDDEKGPENTIVCGDIFELDHSFPAAMGASVHLIERAEPYPTFPYELQAVAALGDRGGRSPDLWGLLPRVGL
ncbi:MAG TPA: HAD family hydrolase [Myxococcota bacterium]|nr:HAD family hydrolase [Myxococcota bacterium]